MSRTRNVQRRIIKAHACIFPLMIADQIPALLSAETIEMAITSSDSRKPNPATDRERPKLAVTPRKQLLNGRTLM